jgi:hypothetical protein
LAGAGRTRRLRATNPTSPRRKEEQRIKDRYAHAREDAQLAGVIPTTPEEALKPERVDSRRTPSPRCARIVARRPARSTSGKVGQAFGLGTVLLLLLWRHGGFPFHGSRHRD